jgi:hypothetical protein
MASSRFLFYKQDAHTALHDDEGEVRYLQTDYAYCAENAQKK